MKQITSTTKATVAPLVVKVSGNEFVDQYGKTVRLLGVNVSGSQQSCLSNSFSFGPTNAAEANGIAKWGANAVRLPLNEDCWLGINGVPAKYSGVAYQTFVKNWVSTLNAAGLLVILDLHYAAPGSYVSNSTWPMADADHAITFWSQVASQFKNVPSVMFELYNEPHLDRGSPTVADWQCWLNGCSGTFQVCDKGQDCQNIAYQTAGMQTMLNAVRAAGAKQPVIISGLDFEGDPCGEFTVPAGSMQGCAWLTYEPQDPLNQLVAGFHSYSTSACNTQTCWNSDVLPVAAKVPVVTGEFGEDDCSSQFVNSYMNWADGHGISYLAWAWNEAPSGSLCSSGAQLNYELVRNWTGSASVIPPQGNAIMTHLQKQNVPK